MSVEIYSKTSLFGVRDNSDNCFEHYDPDGHCHDQRPQTAACSASTDVGLTSNIKAIILSRIRD